MKARASFSSLPASIPEDRRLSSQLGADGVCGVCADDEEEAEGSTDVGADPPAVPPATEGEVPDEEVVEEGSVEEGASGTAVGDAEPPPRSSGMNRKDCK